MKRVLVTGGSGLLGQHLNLVFSKNHKILTTYNNHPGNCREFLSRKIDLLNENDLKILFQEFQPETVIHAAAITNPVPKENQSAKDYFDVNVTATKNIASLCEMYHSKLIYISTDLVYAGYRGSFLKEDAKLIPASLYAETKLVGESKVKEFADNYLILRTGLLYGFGLNHSHCHFHFMFDDLRNNKPVKLFADQFRTPISLNDIAGIITVLADQDISGEIFNLGGLERVSRYELGEMLCSIAGFDKNLLQKITTEDIPNYPKVEDVSLNTEKLKSLGLKARTVEENIRELVANK
ncbi:MAG TPA: SDR family oxidoreductase [Ignavibacteriaceae bacterium]